MAVRITPFDPQFDFLVDHFGSRWLSGANNHPLQIAWQEFQRFLSELPYGSSAYLRPVDLRGSAAVTLVARVANALPRTSQLPGFSEAVAQRLLDAREFESA